MSISMQDMTSLEGIEALGKFDEMLTNSFGKEITEDDYEIISIEPHTDENPFYNTKVYLRSKDETKFPSGEYYYHRIDIYPMIRDTYGCVDTTGFSPWSPMDYNSEELEQGIDRRDGSMIEATLRYIHSGTRMPIEGELTWERVEMSPPNLDFGLPYARIYPDHQSRYFTGEAFLEGSTLDPIMN